jgi:hypothetical protein
MDNKAFFKQFVKDRNEAFYSFDKERILAFIDKYHLPMNRDNDRVFWGAVAKAVVNIKDAPKSAVKRAETLLKNLGFDNELLDYMEN